MADDNSRIESTIKRWETLHGNRSQWDQHFEDLARVMLPRRMGFTSTQMEGGRRTENIYDGTPMQAARALANAVDGFIWSDEVDAFFIRAVDEGLEHTDEVKDWLADCEDRLREALADPRAMFRQARGEVNLDLVVFGTGIMFVGESERMGHLSHASIHLKDSVFVLDDEGHPNTMFRARKYTVQQMVDRFGETALSEETQRLVKDEKWDDKIEVIQVVMPRAEGRANALLSRNWPFADLWIEVAAKHELSERGFPEFPFVVPRWDTSSGEDYGRSPGMIALPDANTLQAMGETILVAGQRAADPPLLVPDDGMLNAPNTFPGGLAYYDVDLAREMGRMPIAPLESGQNLPITRDMQRDMRAQVEAAFYRNIFKLPTERPYMSELEIMQRKAEFLREAGPVFGRLESDYVAPIVERNFKTMLRAGAFLPVPEALAGRSVRFEFKSPITRWKDQINATAAQGWVTGLSALMPVDPTAMDTVNIDEYARFAAESASLPNRLVNGRDKVAARRQARAQAQQQVQAMQQAQMIAESGSKVMKALPAPTQGAGA